ncbi:hypothetical protein ACE193_05040 [Bernardetia sp. OM2101]|uniref:DUF6992 family protein n=1 Tax=Bernardetia sp. OM2101 TaxID=3344876 RepID=UPI0035CFF3E6
MRSYLCISIFFVLIFSCFFISFSAFAQISDIDLPQINKKRLSLQKNSMYVLGGWSVTNFAYSGATLAAGVENGENKYFHQFNIYWNTVNFALAGSSLLFAKKDTDLNYAQTLKAYHSTESLFLLNTGIDIGYMATGLYLRERAKTSTNTKNTNQLLGYGKSLILQGGFLFLFDLTAYTLNKHQSKVLYDIPVSIALAPNQMRVTYVF